MPSFCLTIAAAPDNYDLLIALLSTLPTRGVEEQTAPTTVLAHFGKESEAGAAAETIRQFLSDVSIDITEIADQDWNAEWRKSMKPARIARGWYVSPAWLPPPPAARHWIKIEPKMAFGTGHHETTRLAAQALIARRRWLTGRRVVDMGTGSGVLCFLAERCGAASSLGIELDPECRENLSENLRQNTHEGVIGFFIGSTEAVTHGRFFDLAVMNMILTESAPLLGRISAMLTYGGVLVWSGILDDEHEEAVRLAQRCGLTILSQAREGEWWCGAFECLFTDAA